MNRSGATLIEVLPWLACAIPVVITAGALVNQLIRQGAPPDGQMVDMACDWLRRDAAAGVVIDGNGVIAGGHHWRSSDGWLERDGRTLLPLREFALVHDGRIVAITIRPSSRLPTRHVELELTR